MWGSCKNLQTNPLKMPQLSLAKKVTLHTKEKNHETKE